MIRYCNPHIAILQFHNPVKKRCNPHSLLLCTCNFTPLPYSTAALQPSPCCTAALKTRLKCSTATLFLRHSSSANLILPYHSLGTFTPLYYSAVLQPYPPPTLKLYKLYCTILHFYSFILLHVLQCYIPRPAIMQDCTPPNATL